MGKTQKRSPVFDERPLTAEEHRAYLARIGLKPVRVPSAARLKALHQAHLATVPFENLSRFLKRKIDLSTRALFEKLVTERRGGICYELNVSFASLLRAEGFDPEYLSAEVFGGGAWSNPFDHLLLRVPFDGRAWLVDVGFGAIPTQPLQLSPKLEPRALRRDGPRVVFLERATNGALVPQFRVDLSTRVLREFFVRLHWHQTAAYAPFVKNQVCILPSSAGQLRLVNGRLRVGTSKTELTSAAGLRRALRVHFGLSVPVEKLRPWKLKRR